MSDVLDLQIELANAHAEIYVPGAWHCAKCGFDLTKSLLGSQTGNIAPDLAQHTEPCPNDGEPMQRVKWKQDAIMLAERFSAVMALCQRFEARAKHCRYRAEHERQFLASTPAVVASAKAAMRYWTGRAEAWEIAALNMRQSNKPL